MSIPIMTRKELEHIIRAAGAIADVDRVIILGSQAILAQYPELSEKSESDKVLLSVEDREILFRSVETDIMIPDSVEKTELVEAAIGEFSMFHDTFGYYAQGVDLTTSKLPSGWEDRLVVICNENTNGVAGLCLEIHDLIISKLYAGRPKDFEYFKSAIRLGLLSKETLTERLKQTTMPDERRIQIESYIKRAFSK
ncbi:MAG: hypothetical protein ONB32_16870 [candidate division KSB1 bacterium]|nr:hypothetical protein [candidate division KSB1 bacterium]